MSETYNKLMEYYTKQKSDLVMQCINKEISLDEFKKDATRTIKKHYPEEEKNRSKLIKDLCDELFGYSIITGLINDKTVSDININAWNNIRIKRLGKRMGCGLSFESPEHYKRFMERVLTKNQINASTQNAIAKFTDNNSNADYILRFTLATGYVNTDAIYRLSIRKDPRDFPEMDDLVSEGMMSEPLKDYLIKEWQNSSMIICGANSSGKTTLLNALKETTPHDERVMVIQQAEELTSKSHPDMMFFRTREGKGEIETQYTLKELSVAGLTFDVDRFIIGEIKGEESINLLNAAYTGHKAAGTIHAESSETALDKLIDYALPASSYKKPELEKMLATSFNLVVHMKNYKVNRVSKITGYDPENGISYKQVFPKITEVEEHFGGKAADDTAAQALERIADMLESLISKKDPARPNLKKTSKPMAS